GCRLFGGGIECRTAATAGLQRLVELDAEQLLDLRPIGGSWPRQGTCIQLLKRNRDEPIAGLGDAKAGSAHRYGTSFGELRLRRTAGVPFEERNHVGFVGRRFWNAGNEDAHLRDGLLLLRHDTEIELAGDLGLLGIIGFEGVAGILDDGTRIAPQYSRTFLV